MFRLSRAVSITLQNTCCFHFRKMCILFMHLGTEDPESDYRLVLAANRDEAYDRPSKDLAAWDDDPNVVGGRDLELGCDGGTWMAISPVRRRIGALLNLPTDKDPNAKTRGKIVQDFMKSTISTEEYVDEMRSYFKQCNGFVFVSVDIRDKIKVQTYSNSNDKINTWPGTDFGFSNSLPERPLRKAQVGRELMHDICQRFKKIDQKDCLVNELVEVLLKSQQRHFPDPELEAQKPFVAEQLSSIFVKIPEARYGTRTHTIILVTKAGQVEVVEMTMQQPIDLSNPCWKKSELKV